MLALFHSIVYPYRGLVVIPGQAQYTHSTNPNVCSSVLHLLLGWLVDEPVWLYHSSAGSLARCSHLETAAALSVQLGLQCSHPYFWPSVRSSWKRLPMASSYLSKLVVWL